MKTLATLALLSALFLAAVLPISSPVIESANTFIAGRGGGITRPRTDEQPIFEIDLGTLIAGKGGIISRPRTPDAPPVYDLSTLLAGKGGGVTRPRTDEQPIFGIDLGAPLAGKTGIGGVPPG